MNIAVIGTGNVGSALGTSLTRGGHSVTFAGRDMEKTEKVASDVGASAVTTPRVAAEAADVIVLAVPFSEVESVARELAPAVAGKVVVDATNPLKPDYSGLATEGGPSAAERLAGILPEARVVKAFNTLFASLQADPQSHGARVDGFFATDDEDARASIAALLASIGLRPIDVGPLARARELEALAFLNIQLQLRHGGDWRSAFTLVGAPQTATSPRPVQMAA